MNLDDEQLVKACIRRDQLACKKLYDRFSAQMYGVCLRYSRSTAIAEDILHDGFIKVFDSLPKLRDVSSLSAWIRSIMIHTAISYWKSEHPFVDIDSVGDEPISRLSDSDDIYSAIDIEVILKAVQELPDAYRMAFNLCAIEGYSFDDAAQELSIAPSSVRSNYVRARQALAQKLKPYID